MTNNNVMNNAADFWMDLMIVSKIIDGPIGRNKIFKLLKKKGCLMEGNIPYQKYVETGHFKMEHRPRRNAKGEVVQWYLVTVTSLKGLRLIHDLIEKEKGETNGQTE